MDCGRSAGRWAESLISVLSQQPQQVGVLINLTFQNRPKWFSEGCGRGLSCGQEVVISTARAHFPTPWSIPAKLRQALWTCHLEAVRVVVQGVDSGFVSGLNPFTSCVTLVDLPNHSVPGLSHL